MAKLKYIKRFPILMYAHSKSASISPETVKAIDDFVEKTLDRAIERTLESGKRTVKPWSI